MGEEVAMKLDMNNAYDRVEWRFLKATLEKLGFNIDWVEKVMTLVTTVTYTYQVNGFHSDKLSPSRGLRQEDPLSPYLFILVFDVLSRMINDAKSHNTLSGLKLATEAPALTHLFFADDAILFAQESNYIGDHCDLYLSVDLHIKQIQSSFWAKN